MPDPLVSVLIASYNHEKYIRQAIEGCLMQETSFPFEIIIHDDASTDSSAQIIQEYTDKYPELITTILQTENKYSQGVKIAATLMVPVARGKYIAFCEGDDYWTDPKKLEKQIAIMEKDPSISLCFTATKWVYVNDKKRDKIMRYHHGNHYFSSDAVIMESGRFTDIVSTVVRKEIYKNCAEWFYLPANGDLTLYLLSILGGRAYYLDDITAVYNRGVENSWTTRFHQAPNEKLSYFTKIISMRDAFNEYSNYEFNKSIQKRNYLDIMSLSFIFGEEIEFKDKYFSKFTPFQKVEYYVFHKLFPLKPRYFWHRYHDILRYIGLW